MRSTNTALRPVTVTVTGGPMDPRAYQAVYHKVQKLEDRYERSLNASGVSKDLANITGAKTVLTINQPFIIFVFDLTANFTTGEYTFAFVESAPNVEKAPSLNPTPPEEGEE